MTPRVRNEHFGRKYGEQLSINQVLREQLQVLQETFRWRDPTEERPPYGMPIILKWKHESWPAWNTAIAECHYEDGWYFTYVENSGLGTEEDWIYMGDQNEITWRWMHIPPDPPLIFVPIKAGEPNPDSPATLKET